MFLHILNTLLHSLESACYLFNTANTVGTCSCLLFKLFERHASMIFNCPYSGHKYNCLRIEPCKTALDVEEFLRSQIKSETGLCNCIVREGQCCLWCNYSICSLCYVCKRTTMYKCRSSLQCLHKIRFDCIFQQCSHCSIHLEVAGKNRFLVECISDKDISKPSLEICNII